MMRARHGQQHVTPSNGEQVGSRFGALWIVVSNEKMAPIHPKFMLAINAWIDVRPPAVALAEVCKNLWG